MPRLRSMPPMPRKGDFYYHSKHDPAGPLNNYAYEVVGIARHSEDESLLVLYVPLYENDWMSPADYQARPLAMWQETVTKDGVEMPRFMLITDEAVIAKLKK